MPYDSVGNISHSNHVRFFFFSIRLIFEWIFAETNWEGRWRGYWSTKWIDFVQTEGERERHHNGIPEITEMIFLHILIRFTLPSLIGWSFFLSFIVWRKTEMGRSVQRISNLEKGEHSLLSSSFSSSSGFFFIENGWTDWYLIATNFVREFSSACDHPIFSLNICSDANRENGEKRKRRRRGKTIVFFDDVSDSIRVMKNKW